MVNSKRKVSCLPCRVKKVKCNGEKPCDRCIIRKTNCIYQKPGAVGRPPKNAVVNKLVLSKNNNNSNNSNAVTSNSTTFCREFIFENISLTPVMAPTRYLQDSKELGLSYYVNTLFATYFEASARLDNSRKREKDLTLIRDGDYSFVSPKVKINDLTHLYTWMSADIANILMRRISKLKLTYYCDLEFSTVALQYDCTNTFFETPSNNSLVMNPLNSLPPQQAIRLIECFFHIHPYSCLFNKTMILQSYWTDTTDPLLLTVIYGTTIFKSQLIDGKPLELWDALNKKKRNPFLDYAHILLSKATPEATPSRYQAIVLLALFEVTFGFPKRGMSLFGLSYMLAARLGLFDNTLPPGLNEIEKELLLSTFWSAYQCTIRGCVELEQIPRAALANHLHVFPPINMLASKSYQYDVENNNSRTFTSSFNYLLETFYIQSVVARFSCKLMLLLPTPTVELLPRLPNACVQRYHIESRFKHVESLTERPKGFNIEIGIEKVLQEFKEFNEQNHHQFSTLQENSLEIIRLFYVICLRFLRRSILSSESKFSLFERHLPDKLDLTQVDNILGLQYVFSDAITLVERTFIYLSDPKALEENCIYLPRGVMLSAIDAAAQVFMYSYTLDSNDQKARYYLDMILTILSVDIIWSDWSSAVLVKMSVESFLKKNPPVVIIPDLFTTNIDLDHHELFTMNLKDFDGLSESTTTTDEMMSLLSSSNNQWLNNNNWMVQDLNQLLFSPNETSSSSSSNSSIINYGQPIQQQQEGGRQRQKQKQQESLVTAANIDLLVGDLF